jgi:hypothetical protein
MKYIINTCKTWSPGIWVSLTGISCVLGMDGSSLGAKLVGLAALTALCVLALGVTLLPEDHK